jgi:8-oxo-dGTP pyrophosphatase MutT (NUDIX family)
VIAQAYQSIMNPQPPFTLRPAATLVIFRQSSADPAPQLLMVERAATMRFAAGATVFPGGKVDPQDAELAQILTGEAQDEYSDMAARIAAIRETLEETGLALGFTRGPTREEAMEARAILQAGATMADMLKRLDLSLDLSLLTPLPVGGAKVSEDLTLASIWPISVRAQSIFWSMPRKTVVFLGQCRAMSGRCGQRRYQDHPADTA